MSVFRTNSTALITGGASGIGLAVAQLCLKQGMRVAVADFNSTTLGLAKKTLDGGDNAKFYNVDVSKEEDWKGLREKVGDVDFLMLNAGVGTKGTWGDAEYMMKIFNTNLFGVTNGLNTYVPSFLARRSTTPSAIVITGSKQGITNPPGNAAYNASKAAVKSLAEHLSFDLKDTNTSVHLLVPGWTFTGLSGNTPGSNTTKPNGAWHASQVVDYMYQKMQDGKFYIICPDDDVSEATDKKRMLWTVGDVVEGRQPLSRWREEYKSEAEKWMKEKQV
ncbi:NAD(P)-binding protein [Pleomassaria siparia CBS 279.74]|uniref:NAD(P)-binding protein n=1 Tax=Pleomassaria siparia CBS 279.74 TaxID=1314801 RepID=A0A6G1KLT9_9PLEO|nr:NAD(P)-binding protein [Pleomassaria siparia CBS 279.74]